MGQLGLAWMENNWSCPWQLQLWLFLRYFVQTHLCLEKLTPGTSWSWKVIWEYNFIHIRVIPVSLNLSQLSLFPPSLPSLSYPTFPLSPITITTILSLSLSLSLSHTHTHTLFSHVVDPEKREIQKESQLTSGRTHIINYFKLSSIQLFPPTLLPVCFHLSHLWTSENISPFIVITEGLIRLGKY